MPLTKPPLKTLLFILLGALVVRASLLEYTNLVDPTEARYASVAQEMVLSGDWLTPKLPMAEGTVPYMGKPPLHFWLTAISYSLFGVDEWSSRLPSFVGTVLLLLLIVSFTSKMFGRLEGLTAGLIFFSSAMIFFLAGASVTDVTLTLMISASTVLLYLFCASDSAPRYLLLIAAAFAALGFLTKGPISLVLTILPILLWSLLRRDISWLKRIPWIPTVAVFLAIAAPWFILSERETPGFLKYFFWNENIARYLFKDYGDKYGSGHIFPYGMSWVMIAGAFLPWTLVLGALMLRMKSRSLRDLVQRNSGFAFALCWAISAPLFFTLVKQLHALYILPALPGMSILTGVLLVREGASLHRIARFAASPAFLLLFGVSAFGLLLTGEFFSLSFQSALLACLFSLAAVIVLMVLKKRIGASACVSQFSVALFALFSIALTSISPYINLSKSAEDVLREISLSDGFESGSVPVRVGISSKNTFSHYWTAKASDTELDRPVVVEYIDPRDVAASTVRHYLVKSKSLKLVPRSMADTFSLVRQTGEWSIYLRKKTLSLEAKN